MHYDVRLLHTCYRLIIRLKIQLQIQLPITTGWVNVSAF